jgi:hypothetical protein
MKSWAHTYMAGSLLGTILIVAALVTFVPLVSLNAPDEWPTPGLGLDAGGGDVGVGTAVVAAAKHAEASGPNSDPIGGASAVSGAPNVAIRASGRGLHTGRPGDAETDAPAKGTVAVSPASAEVIARNPGSPTSEGAGGAGPPPSPTETGSTPVPTATDGEVDDIGDLGETPSTTPIEAGVGAVGPDSQPPERPDSVPPPPSGSSTEGSDASDCAEEDSEGEAAQAGYSDSQVGSALNVPPGADGAEVVDPGVADPNLPAPGLVDVSPDR